MVTPLCSVSCSPRAITSSYIFSCFAALRLVSAWKHCRESPTYTETSELACRSAKTVFVMGVRDHFHCHPPPVSCNVQHRQPHNSGIPLIDGIKQLRESFWMLGPWLQPYDQGPCWEWIKFLIALTISSPLLPPQQDTRGDSSLIAKLVDPGLLVVIDETSVWNPLLPCLALSQKRI